MATIYVTQHTYSVLLIRNKMKDNKPFCEQLLNGMEVTDIFKSSEVSKNLSFLKNTLSVCFLSFKSIMAFL